MWVRDFDLCGERGIERGAELKAWSNLSLGAGGTSGTVTAVRERKSNLGKESEKESLKYSDRFGERETVVCLVELKSLKFKCLIIVKCGLG